MRTRKWKNVTCRKCNEKPARFIGLCKPCYRGEREGFKPIHIHLKERNFIRDGVGVLTGRKGEEYLVDIDDFEKFKGLLWCGNGNGYGMTNLPDGKRLYLHKAVAPQWKIVDHKNRNRLDNRRSNLRDGGNGVNELNKSLSGDTYSGIRGIHKMRDRWQVRIMGARRRVYLGTFNTITEAKNALTEYASRNGLIEFYG